MHFNYSVTNTKEFKFNPTSLDIYIGEKETADDGTEVINVQTVLTETQPGKTTVETADHKFPLTMLQPAIKAFKLGDTQPEVDEAALAKLLAPFSLQLKQAEEAKV